MWQPGSKTALHALEEWRGVGKSFRVSTQSIAAEGDITRPRLPHNESGLIKALEHEGVGRPSTYASIVDKLYDKRYVEKSGIIKKSVKAISYTKDFKTVNKPPSIVRTEREIKVSESTDFMIPTPLGYKIIDYLENATPFILDLNFTSNMEGDLDKISQGSISKNEVLSRFYNDFSTFIITATQQNKEISPSKIQQKAPPIKTFVIDNIPYEVRVSKYGPVIFNATNKQYINLSAFLEWRKLTPETLTETDMGFLVSLPKQISNSDYKRAG